MNTLPISEIRENPNNPRTISKEDFRKLVKSIKEFPEMLEARPIVIDPDNMVIGGNMRLRACKELGMKEVPIYKASWNQALRMRFIIADNLIFGDHDWDILANEWDAIELEDWGLDVWTPDEEIEATSEESKCECCNQTIK